MTAVRPAPPSCPADRRIGARAAAAVLAFLVVLVVPGCSARLVRGAATPAELAVTDVTDTELPITGSADGNDVDRIARDSLADLTTFWRQQLPQVYATDFTPLTGGIYSVDPAHVRRRDYPDGEVGCGEKPSEVAENAFYCAASKKYPNGDAIQYDRVYLGSLVADYGPFIPALVMAHEFGHAVQARAGYPSSRSIAIETQADCFAGSWTAWVARGDAAHSTIAAPDLDAVLRGYLLLRDPVGTGSDEQEAHGSYFDRVSAFQEGFDSGPTACRDDFGRDRQYTQTSFSADDLLSGGNASYADTVDTFAPQGLDEFWTSTFSDRGAAAFVAPALRSFRGTAPGCTGSAETADLLYCPADRTVEYDERDLTRPLYADPDGGDYAVLTAIAVPYALAARDQLGLATSGQDAVRSAVCLAGAFTGSVLEGRNDTVSISPGDVDESVSFLLADAGRNTVLGDAGATGFQLVDVFRSGVLQGVGACSLS